MANNFSFSKNTADEQLEIALLAFQNFESNSINEDFADKCAEEINKCLDYIHREKLCNCNFKKFSKCRPKIFSNCSELEIILDIADSSKHSGIDRNKYVVKSAEKHNGSFSDAFSREFDISKLIIITKDSDSELFFIDIAKKSLAYLVTLVRPNKAINQTRS